MAQFVARKDKDGPFLALRWRLGFVNFMEILHWCRFRLETPLQHRIEVSFLCDFWINSSIDVHRPANVNNFHSRVIWRNFINFIFVRHRIALDITRRPVLFKKKKKKKNLKLTTKSKVTKWKKLPRESETIRQGPALSPHILASNLPSERVADIQRQPHWPWNSSPFCRQIYWRRRR